jgi:protein-L-isoaspartate O-methyltransferase
VAWAQAPPAIPAAWIEQVHPGGIIVAPLRRRTPQVARLRVLSTHQVSEEQQIAAGFIPLTSKPLRALGRRPRTRLTTGPTRAPKRHPGYLIP